MEVTLIVYNYVLNSIQTKSADRIVRIMFLYFVI